MHGAGNAKRALLGRSYRKHTPQILMKGGGMAQIELVCTEVDCKHNDGDQACILETVTIGSAGQCEDYEEEN